MGITNRLKAAAYALLAPAPTTKYLSPVGDGWLGAWAGTNNVNGDLTPDKYGFAQAYSVVDAVRSCVDIYADTVEGVPWKITRVTDDADEDAIVSQSDDPRPRHQWDKVLNRYRRKYNVNFLRHLTYSTVLYDESFVWLMPNEYRVISDLRWLNPIGVTVEDYTGYITGFRYTGTNGQFRLFLPHEIAYDHGYNPFDDNRGSSTVLATINNINISNNVKRFLRDFFVNNARPGFVATPKSHEDANNPSFREALKREFTQFMKGSGNQFNTLISMLPLDMTAFEQPDISKQYTVNTEIRKEIYAAFGVPMGMSGDTSATVYKETEDVMRAFLQLRVKPLLVRLQEFINDAILPRLTGSDEYRFEFDLDKFNLLSENDVRYAELTRSDMQAGLIPINVAQEKRGYQVDSDLEDIYLINGQPMSKDTIIKLSSTLPSQNILDLSQAFGQLSMSQPSHGLPSGTMPQEQQATNSNLNVQYDEYGTAIPTAEIFGYHVESGIVKPDEARAQLGLPPLPPSEDGDISKLQAQLTAVLDAMDTGLTREQALELVGLDKDPAVQDDSTDPIIDELKTWRKVAKSNTQKAITRFQTFHVPEYIDQWVRDELLSGSDIKSVFSDAEYVVVKPTFATKGFQDTSTAFVNEIKQIIGDAQNDAITRSKFGGAMRSALRRYGLVAFRQGLESEGYQSESLGEEELKAFRDWQSITSGYISDFGSEIFKEGGISEAEIGLRSEYWVNKSLREIYYKGVLLAANPTSIKRWVRNPLKDSCSDCISRDGKLLPLSEWEKLGLPGSDTLECNGYNCGCDLETVENSDQKTYDFEATFASLKATLEKHHANHHH